MFEPALTRSSAPLDPLSAPPEPKSSAPATVSSLIPFVPLVEETLSKVALAVPLVRSSACPLPASVTSLRLRVPKPEPTMSLTAVLPTFRPRIVFPEPSVIALPAAVVSEGRVPPVVG